MKMKALTFSYDDGVMYDQRLIEIFNRYGIKATFNINTGGEPGMQGWYTDNGTLVKRADFFDESVIRSYDGHEIACHTRTHPWLNKASNEALEYELLGNRDDLGAMFGRTPCGVAYPFNTYDDRCIKLLRENGFLYAREGGCYSDTKSFDLQSELFAYKPTCHHDYENIYELADEFINSQYDSLKIFYIWGHSYEFEDFNNWDHIERLCEKLSGHDDIFYGTNEEVFRLQKEWERNIR